MAELSWVERGLTDLPRSLGVNAQMRRRGAQVEVGGGESATCEVGTLRGRQSKTMQQSERGAARGQAVFTTCTAARQDKMHLRKKFGVRGAGSGHGRSWELGWVALCSVQIDLPRCATVERGAKVGRGRGNAEGGVVKMLRRERVEHWDQRADGSVVYAGDVLGAPSNASWCFQTGARPIPVLRCCTLALCWPILMLRGAR